MGGNVEQSKLPGVQVPVLFGRLSLLFDISTDYSLPAAMPDRIDKVAAGPEGVGPELLLQCG